MVSERIELHCHSLYSDGTLCPTELVVLAAARAVRLLALTDHDTTAGCAEAAAACRQQRIAFIAGVELTCQWQAQEIHIVGLDLDVEAPALRAYCQAVQQQRRARLEGMLERLRGLGLPTEPLREAALAASSATRTHLARALHTHGWARSVQEAFDRYLQRGRPAWCEASWPALAAAVQCIVTSGGLAVLAHPHRYRLSGAALSALLTAFRAAGGVGLEVSLAGMSPSDADRAARLARRHDLAGSVGSDFHEPGLPWRPLGRFAKLPEAVRPIMMCRGGLGAVPLVAQGHSGR